MTPATQKPSGLTRVGHAAAFAFVTVFAAVGLILTIGAALYLLWLAWAASPVVTLVVAGVMAGVAVVALAYRQAKQTDIAAAEMPQTLAEFRARKDSIARKVKRAVDGAA